MPYILFRTAAIKLNIRIQTQSNHVENANAHSIHNKFERNSNESNHADLVIYIVIARIFT